MLESISPLEILDQKHLMKLIALVQRSNMQHLRLSFMLMQLMLSLMLGLLSLMLATRALRVVLRLALLLPVAH